jgi:hypothetical protein
MENTHGETEMTDAAITPTKTIGVTLNAFLLEAAPLALLKTAAPGNNFISLNTQDAALLCLSELPEIPPSISTTIIKALRTGQRKLETAILDESGSKGERKCTGD